MSKTKGFGPRNKKMQPLRYSYKGNSVSMVKDNFDEDINLYEVGVFLKNGKNYVERHLTKQEAIKLYKSYKRMIKEI